MIGFGGTGPVAPGRPRSLGQGGATRNKPHLVEGRRRRRRWPAQGWRAGSDRGSPVIGMRSGARSPVRNAGDAGHIGVADPAGDHSTTSTKRSEDGLGGENAPPRGCDNGVLHTYVGAEAGYRMSSRGWSSGTHRRRARRRCAAPGHCGQPVADARRERDIRPLPRTR